jgi:hypothetical protein
MSAVLTTGVAHLFEILLPFDSAKPGRLLADAPIQRAVDRSLPASDSLNVRVGPTRLQPLHSPRDTLLFDASRHLLEPLRRSVLVRPSIRRRETCVRTTLKPNRPAPGICRLRMAASIAPRSVARFAWPSVRQSVILTVPGVHRLRGRSIKTARTTGKPCACVQPASAAGMIATDDPSAASPSAVKRQNSRVLRPLRKTAGNRWHDRRERSRATLYRIGTPRAR